MKTETYKNKKGDTRYRPVMTEPEFRNADDQMNGFCLACGSEQIGGCEPDARQYECESCGESKVYGYSELLLMGLVKIVDVTKAGDALQAARKTRRGGRQPKCFCGTCTACYKRKWRAGKKRS